MIKLDWTLFLQFANFMILMVVLNALLFKPLRAALQARREAIESSKAKVHDIDEQVQAQIARYEAQLQDARLQGAQERATLRKAGQEEEARILGAANQTAAEKLQTIKEQIQEEAGTARQALRDETEDLAREIAGKVLGRAI
ncbi:MAG: ATP synthase F0 subunit B [Deltaproteobacteria bacterium]|nr:ATP synthase F0 subunit B [Deltaproteobacteria bacterium]MBW2512310.1 ATP synthase F0 subunit B [Deltaproteobacteria bacterium]MDH4007419.1 ATP synthase F0 subunit B [Desulfuromonadales bacterium]